MTASESVSASGGVDRWKALRASRRRRLFTEPPNARSLGRARFRLRRDEIANGGGHGAATEASEASRTPRFFRRINTPATRAMIESPKRVGRRETRHTSESLFAREGHARGESFDAPIAERNSGCSYFERVSGRSRSHASLVEARRDPLEAWPRKPRGIESREPDLITEESSAPSTRCPRRGRGERVREARNCGVAAAFEVRRVAERGNA